MYNNDILQLIEDNMKSNTRSTSERNIKSNAKAQKPFSFDKENIINIPFEDSYTKADTIKKEAIIINEADIRSEILKELQEINIPGKDIYKVFDDNSEAAIMNEFSIR